MQDEEGNFDQYDDSISSIVKHLFVLPFHGNQFKKEGWTQKHDVKQENIPLGCVPPACQAYLLRWPTDIFGGGVGTV